ncbi:MAG: lipid-A-disaccharide synthase, partial [Alphaproteobacteria bacterium]|nr:lipid-A-disaccharide synthase [Alphaproteobacteria bacterium]
MKIFIGAGEDSGDLLGGRLIKELKKRHPMCEIIGVGGPQMLASGLSRSLFPMEDLSLMGFFEILPKLLKILGHLRKIKQFILMEKPDVVITIDAPDFYLRVLRGIKKSSNIPTIHYNAPAVWASRPKRAKKIATFVDHLLCLFP